MATKDSDISEVKKEGLHEAASCCICTDVYTNPKLLPCSHTFCMKCIQETGLKTNKGPDDDMSCPMCKQQFKIPPEGFNGLPANSFIEKLIQVENILDQSVSSKDVCDACLEENEEETSDQIPAADVYCVECKQKLCEECCIHHRKVKLTKNHKLVPIEELQKCSEIVMSSLVPYVCELHEQKVLDVYCMKCDAVVCAICFIDEHKNHEGSHVSKFVNAFQQQIELHTGLMNECSSKVQRKKSEFLKLREDLQQKVENLEADVVNRKDEMKQLVDVHAHSMLQGIGVLQRYKLKELEVATGEVDAYLSVLESFKTSCLKAAQGTPSHICRSASNLSARAAELQQQCQSLVEQEIESFRVGLCFKKLEFEEFLQSQGGNLIGQIGEEQYPEPKESSKGKQTTIKALEANVENLKQDLNTEKTTNIAFQDKVENLLQELDNERKSNENLRQKIVTERKIAKEELTRTKADFQDLILKLELNLGQEKREREKAQEEKTKLAKLRYKSDPVLTQTIAPRAVEKKNKVPRGLAILDKELFVVSGECSEVEVYHLKKLSLSRRWNLKELSAPQDMGSCKMNKCLYIHDYKGTDQSKEILRVDTNGNLVKQWSTEDDWGYCISVTDESNVILTVTAKNKLNEYSSDGQLIRELSLSSVAGIRFPFLAIKLPNDHFLVSHGRVAGEPHRVCVVDAELNVQKSFRGAPGSTIGSMREPSYIAIDGNGFIMVVDSDNSRVFLLDSDLQFKREILSKERHGLGSPYGIFVDETNGRLFVFDSKFKSKNKLHKDAPIAVFDF